VAVTNGVEREALFEEDVPAEVGGAGAALLLVGRTNPKPTRGLGRPIGRSSIGAGRMEGAVPKAFMAIDRCGAAMVRAGGAEGTGLPGGEARPGGIAFTFATPAGMGTAALVAAAGTEEEEDLAFSIRGMIVDLDAGFRLEV
jgi:hypothetical protein